MIRIQGIPAVAERLRAVNLTAPQRAKRLRAKAPRQQTRQPGDEVQSGIDMEPGQSFRASSHTSRYLRARKTSLGDTRSLVCPSSPHPPWIRAEPRCGLSANSRLLDKTDCFWKLFEPVMATLGRGCRSEVAAQLWPWRGQLN